MPLPDAEAGTVDALGAQFCDLLQRHQPTSAVGMGLYDRAGELPEPTDAAADAYVRDLDGLARRVRDHDAGANVPADVDRRGLLARIEADRLHLAHAPAHRRNPMAAAMTVVSSVFVLLSRDHLPDDVRVEGIRALCRGAPAFLSTARDSLRPEEVPAKWVQMAYGTASAATSLLREQVPGAVPQVTDDAEQAAAALEDFAGWLDDVLMPAAAGAFAFGEEATAALLADHHQVTKSPADVANEGEELCANLDALLVEAAGRDDWQAALEEAKADHPARDGLVDAYRAEFDRMTRACRDADIVTDPGVEATLEATPEFLRSLLSYAAYFPPGEFDVGGSGRLWVTPPPEDAGLRDHSHAMIPAIVAHEGYPGHHLQLTAVRRNPGVMRRLRISTLMTEGWGLYTEELMAEVGAYSDAARLGQLSLRKLRAVRIVVDMGLHAGGMTEEEAVARMVDETGMDAGIASAEVARYTMTPGQPFSYLYGAEQIHRLRADWQAATGGSLRQFHDALLAYGHLPPSLAAEGMLSGP